MPPDSASSSDRPAAEGIAPGHFPPSAVEAGHHVPAPRRVRGRIGSTWVFDTTAATYVWEHPYYPQYAVPLADVRADLLVDDGVTRDDAIGPVARHSLSVDGEVRRGVASVRRESPVAGLVNTVIFKWPGVDHWYEEDEEIFVHPRSPYVRVEAQPSSRTVRVEVGGVVIAESSHPVGVFETGLPPRWYLPPTDVDWSLLERSDTETQCPYKGTTSDYWSLRSGDLVVTDVAWSYQFPRREVLPIAGLVAFYDDKADISLA